MEFCDCLDFTRVHGISKLFFIGNSDKLVDVDHMHPKLPIHRIKHASKLYPVCLVIVCCMGFTNLVLEQKLH